MDVRQLEGKLLSYWVMRSLNLEPTLMFNKIPIITCGDVPFDTGSRHHDHFDPAANIAHAWPIIQQDKIQHHWNGVSWNAAMAGHSANDPQHEIWKGCIYGADDPLTAMMRCKVASVFGEVVPDTIFNLAEMQKKK